MDALRQPGRSVPDGQPGDQPECAGLLGEMDAWLQRKLDAQGDAFLPGLDYVCQWATPWTSARQCPSRRASCGSLTPETPWTIGLPDRSWHAAANAAWRRRLSLTGDASSGNSAKLAFIGWNVFGSACVMYARSAPAIVVGGKSSGVWPKAARAAIHAGQQAAHRRANVPLSAGDLPGEKEAVPIMPLQRRPQQHRAVDVSVAMHLPEAHELGTLQSWDHTQDPLLITPLEIGLEADKVVERAGGVILANLHRSEWSPPRARVRASPSASAAHMPAHPARAPPAPRWEDTPQSSVGHPGQARTPAG